MANVCNEQMSATSPFVGVIPLAQVSRKKLSNSEKLKMLNDAFERLYANKPLNVPKWTAIDKHAVEAEANLPSNTLQDRIQYQEKLLSKIYIAQELELLKNCNFPSFSYRKKAKRRQELISKLYHALNRLIDNTPKIVKKGTKISPYTVSLEAGGSGSYFIGAGRYLDEVLRDIEMAKQAQQNESYKKKHTDITPSPTRAREMQLRLALERLINGQGEILKNNTQITIKTVCVEAGYQSDLIRKNQDYFRKFITEVEQAEVQRITKLCNQAIDRLIKNNPLKVPLNCKITPEVVSVEAGLVRSFLNCYKSLFTEIINKIKLISAEKSLS